MLSRVNSYTHRMEARYPEPIRTCKNGFRTDPMKEPCSSNPGPSNMGGMEESEVVDELLQILVECTKKADIRGQEILLRKFFLEIEKEIPLQRFLVERLKQSKISGLFDKNIFRPEMEVSDRELNVCEGETSEREKMERFKVKTVQVGVVVKEEKSI